MNVLFIIRSSIEQLSGGDKIQIIGTKQALEKLGVTVTISSEAAPDFSGIDIVHAFNPSQLSAVPLRAAHAAGIPVVISTIHWDMRTYYRAMFAVNREYLSLKPPHYARHYVTSQFKALLYNYFWNPYVLRKLRSVFHLADLLLPNSNAEADLLINDFSIPKDRIVPVVNGFDATMAERATAGRFKRERHLDDFVLCAGRVEYRKNQLALIEALMHEPYPLVFIGRPFDRGYMALCTTLGERRGNTVFIDHMDQQQLYGAYRDARVHALVSWYETPGLSSLEAGAAGTNLVVTRGGCTEEYFGTDAVYCEPDDATSINNAVCKAWDMPKSDALRKRVAEKYSWDEAGRQTLAAYRRVKTAQQ
ncbi:MAG: glycosyltransferase family 4 protein [Candidatus Kerfeldbacteria bacterium]